MDINVNFVCASASSDDETVEPPLASLKVKGERTAVAEPRRGRPSTAGQMCFACDTELAVKGSKYCNKHKKAVQNLVADAGAQFEKDAVLEILEDKQMGGKMVLDYAEMKADGKLKRGLKIDWTKWKVTYSVRKSVKDRCKVKKMDWELFKCYWLQKRGWSTERSLQEWNK